MLYLFANCALDTDRRELRRGTRPVPIEPQVFDILEFLIANRSRVVSKDDLREAIWRGRIVSESALSTRLNSARAAIGDDGDAQRFIRTLPRKGVRFVAEVHVEPKTVQAAKLTAAAPHSAAENGAEQPEYVSALSEKPSSIGGRRST